MGDVRGDAAEGGRVKDSRQPVGQGRTGTGGVLLLWRRWLPVALLVCVAAFALGRQASRPPAPLGDDAPLEAFSAARATAIIERLLADVGPHPVGTPANAVVRDRIIAEFEGLGYDVEVQAEFGCRVQWSLCGHIENIIVRLAGAAPGPAVMLTAHYDSVGAGPGVSDDMVGVAAVLEAARILRAGPVPRNPVVFLISDGEEAGLLGAEAFMLHPAAAEVAAVVNLEARGSSGPSMLFETSPGNAGLIDAFLSRARRPVTNSLLYELYQRLPNDTDFSVYKEAGKAGVNFAYVDEVVNYHTPNDDLARLDQRSLQHQGDNALAAITALAATDLAALDRGELVYADIAPGVVVRWPANLAAWLAGASLLAWLMIAAAAVRAGLAGWGRIALALLMTLLGVALAAAVGWLVVSALVSLSGLPQPWYSDPAPSRAVVWAAAVLALLLCLWSVARRVGAWSLNAGVWLLWSLLALASAVLVTGSSYLFQIPLAVATLLFGAVALSGRMAAQVAVALAGVVAAAATTYLWLPFALAVEGGLGFAMAPALAVMVALTASSLGGLLSQRQRGPGGQTAPARATVAALLVVVMLIGTGFAFTRDPFTVQRPQRLNIAHLQSSNLGPVWLLLPEYGPEHEARLLPGSLMAAGAFGLERVTPSPLLDASVPASPAPSAGELPRIEVLAQRAGGSSEGNARVVRVRLAVAGDADVVELRYSAPLGASSVRFVGSDYELAPDDPNVRGRTLRCHGRACAGMEVEFALRGQGDLDLTLAAYSYGLPPGGEALLAARPATAVASHQGDVSVRLTSLTVGP